MGHSVSIVPAENNLYDTVGVAVTVEGDHTNAGNNYVAMATLTGDRAGNYSLPSECSTTFSIAKAAARTIADVTQSLYFEATSVTVSIDGKMPQDAGELTYTPGTASANGSVAVSDFAMDESGNVSATLSGGAVGDSFTLSVTISSTNYEDSAVNVIVTLADKTDAGVIITPSGAQTKTYGDEGFTLEAVVTDATRLSTSGSTASTRSSSPDTGDPTSFAAALALAATGAGAIIASRRRHK